MLLTRFNNKIQLLSTWPVPYEKPPMSIDWHPLGPGGGSPFVSPRQGNHQSTNGALSIFTTITTISIVP
jgi:hypothetical protein